MLVFGVWPGRRFRVLINDELLTMEDIPGEVAKEEVTLENAGHRYGYLHDNRPKRRGKLPGVVVRVQGKSSACHRTWGSKRQRRYRHQDLKRLHGEIQADGLGDAVTASFGSFIENNKGYEEVRLWAQGEDPGSGKRLRASAKSIWRALASAGY